MTKRQGKSGAIDVKALLREDEEFLRALVRAALQEVLEVEMTDPVREHRAMAPSHGFAAASHSEAVLRGAPPSHGETAFRGAAGFRAVSRGICAWDGLLRVYVLNWPAFSREAPSQALAVRAHPPGCAE